MCGFETIINSVDINVASLHFVVANLLERPTCRALNIIKHLHHQTIHSYWFEMGLLCGVQAVPVLNLALPRQPAVSRAAEGTMFTHLQRKMSVPLDNGGLRSLQSKLKFFFKVLY